MEIMHFQFENIDKLKETAYHLRKQYDHIMISYNDSKLVLNVECTNSLIFDTRIISYVNDHGGRKIVLD